MLDDKVRAELDQSRAAIIEVFPSIWRGLYLACVKEGFSELEAMELVKTYILSQGNNGK